MLWNSRLDWESQEGDSATGTTSDSLTAASKTGSERLDRLAAVAASEVESPVKILVASETTVARGFRSRRTPRRLPWPAIGLPASGDRISAHDYGDLEASQRRSQSPHHHFSPKSGPQVGKRGRPIPHNVSSAVNLTMATPSNHSRVPPLPKKVNIDSRIQRFGMKVLGIIDDGHSVKKSFIRASCGNNPDISKALRVLVSEKKVLRIGSGGRKNPFWYQKIEGKALVTSDQDTWLIPDLNAPPLSDMMIDDVADTCPPPTDEQCDVSQPRSIITTTSTQDQASLPLQDTPVDYTEEEEIIEMV